jgi:hypothetical protein
VGEALGWIGYPRDMKDLLSKWLPREFGVSYQLGLTCFTGLSWAIWTVRNKISMQKKFPNSPIDVIYSSLSFIQKVKEFDGVAGEDQGGANANSGESARTGIQAIG